MCHKTGVNTARTLYTCNVWPSVADTGCLSRIRNFPSRIPRVQKIPDPGFAAKNLSIFNPEKLFLSPWKYDPGCSSRLQILPFQPIPDPGSRGQKGTGSRYKHWAFYQNVKINLICMVWSTRFNNQAQGKTKHTVTGIQQSISRQIATSNVPKQKKLVWCQCSST